MREIKFRGKNLATGSWSYGYLAGIEDLPLGKVGRIVLRDGDYARDSLVFSETIGQYTGQKDVDGNEIYDGDIIEQDETCRTRFVVVFDDSAFRIATKAQKESLDCHCHPFFEGYRELPSLNSAQMSAPFRVIGNIFDNPDLI